MVPDAPPVRGPDPHSTPAAQAMTGESTNLLVIDTSTGQPAVGIRSRAGGVYVSSFLATGRHGRDLVPSIGNLLREANLRVMDLGVVAVGLGPGSYTGLRIGLTAARTLAYTAGAVLLGFDSLEGWARTAPPEAPACTSWPTPSVATSMPPIFFATRSSNP